MSLCRRCRHAAAVDRGHCGACKGFAILGLKIKRAREAQKAVKSGRVSARAIIEGTTKRFKKVELFRL